MPYITVAGQDRKVYANVIIRPVPGGLEVVQDYVYRPDLEATTGFYSTAGQDRNRVLDQIVADVAPGYSTVWLGKGWTLEWTGPLFATQG